MGKSLKKKKLLKKKGIKYLKDKSIIKFILQHEEKINVDFSKFKIPSFLDYLKGEEDKNNSFSRDNFLKDEQRFDNPKIDSQMKKKYPEFKCESLFKLKNEPQDKLNFCSWIFSEKTTDKN